MTVSLKSEKDRPGQQGLGKGASGVAYVIGRNPTTCFFFFEKKNFTIRFGSWKYRGCWHQHRPPIDS